MKTKLTLMTAALILVLALSACGGTDAQPSMNLDGTSWILNTYAKNLPIAGAEPTLSFKDGQVSGNASCNSYGGSYTVKGSDLSFGNLFMTEMYCTDPEGIMDQESVYLQLLGQATSFEIQDGILVIHTDGQDDLTFTPAK